MVSDHVLITFCLMMVRCDSYDHLDMQPTVLVISEGYRLHWFAPKTLF